MFEEIIRVNGFVSFEYHISNMDVPHPVYPICFESIMFIKCEEIPQAQRFLPKIRNYHPIHD